MEAGKGWEFVGGTDVVKGWEFGGGIGAVSGALQGVCKFVPEL
jgi:ABC-type glucose/galactose transport system permease subunit